MAKDTRGFTLIELIVVISIIALITTVASTRVDSIVAWKQRKDLREFINVWEFLHHQAIRRRESYRLVINIDEGSYYVRKEIKAAAGTLVRDVDYLSNLRTQGEKKRREEEEEEKLQDLNSQFEAEDQIQEGALEGLFYKFYYDDPNTPTTLGSPLDFPSLAKERSFTYGLFFKDIQTQGETYDSGEVFIRFSSRGVSNFSVIHVNYDEDEVYTVAMNPATGKVFIRDGYKEIRWEKSGNEQ